jgi:cell division protein FtsZ
MTDQTPAEVLAVGIGSAGSRIVSLLSRESLLVDRFVYISCDRNDLGPELKGEKIQIESPVDQKLNPAMVRGLALRSTSEIRRALEGAKVVFVVAGLGGATGSGLAPMVAAMAHECGAVPVGVAVMPFDYEKRLRFHAGVSLRRLRAAARGVIVIDNDTLLRSSPNESTLTDVYGSANRDAVRTLSSLLVRSSDSAVPAGLNKVLGTVLQEGYALLGVSSSISPDKAEEALAGAVVSIGKIAETKEASHAIVVLSGDTTLSASEVGLAVKRLGFMIDNQSVDVEYAVNYSGSAQLQVGLLASGFKSTKYDDYDPLGKILGGRSIDEETDFSLFEGLETLQSCEY